MINGIVPDAELEAFIGSLKKRSFTHQDVTHCYSTFVKNEYHQNDDNVQQQPEIYGRQRSGGKRIPIRWSEQETEALKEGVARLGKGNWSRIIGLYPDIFGPTARTGRDLKKKWISIESKGNRKNHSATRLKATLMLPNQEMLPGMPPTVQEMTSILPDAVINTSEAIIHATSINNNDAIINNNDVSSSNVTVINNSDATINSNDTINNSVTKKDPQIINPPNFLNLTNSIND
ncbi:hypothetical protein M9Y10_009589 [Tritrichomonas musculus]|uniref:Myb-like DNA-binding domain containing protein n=1 Tax=Tritrichomonas musculus TaxID=1915356 RepID=A0ABR2INS8_9EUKA